MALRTLTLCLALTLLTGCGLLPDDDRSLSSGLAERTCERDDAPLTELLLPVPRGSGPLGDYPVNQQPTLPDYLRDQYDDAASRQDVRGELRSRNLEKIAIRTWEDRDHNITQVVMLRFGSDDEAEEWAGWESDSWQDEEDRVPFAVSGWSDADGWRTAELNDGGEINADVLAHAGPVMVDIRYWTPDRFNRAYVQRITDAQLTRLGC